VMWALDSYGLSLPIIIGGYVMLFFRGYWLDFFIAHTGVLVYSE